jgi:hypothetical protein
MAIKHSPESETVRRPRQLVVLARRHMLIVMTGIIMLVAWSAAHCTGYFRAALCVIMVGYGVILGSLFMKGRGIAVTKRGYLANLALITAFMLLSAYCFAAVGVLTDAFNNNAPYGFISAIYLILPFSLVGGAVLIDRSTTAYAMITASLVLSLLIGGYCEYVTLDLLFEMPELLGRFATTSSNLHFYNAVLAFLVVIFPPIIFYGLLSACSLPDGKSRLRAGNLVIAAPNC